MGAWPKNVNKSLEEKKVRLEKNLWIYQVFDQKYSELRIQWLKKFCDTLVFNSEFDKEMSFQVWNVKFWLTQSSFLFISFKIALYSIWAMDSKAWFCPHLAYGPT